MVFKSLKKIFGGDVSEAEYIEVDLGTQVKKAKIIVKPFILTKFEDTNSILNSLREGYTIAVIDIRPLKAKDIIEVKRAISKIKKTADALEGDIAGFGEGIVIVTPSFAEITKVPIVEKKPENLREDY